MAAERKLVQVAQSSLLLALHRSPGLPDPLHRIPAEERLMALVDRLDLQLLLVAGEMQVVLAV
jgi:hypothetical protein